MGFDHAAVSQIEEAAEAVLDVVVLVVDLLRCAEIMTRRPMLAGASQHDHPGAAIVAGPRDRLIELKQQRRALAVAVARPIDRDFRNAIFDLIQNVLLLAHAGFLRFVAAFRRNPSRSGLSWLALAN